jgi:hypothetical protein
MTPSFVFRRAFALLGDLALVIVYAVSLNMPR